MGAVVLWNGNSSSDPGNFAEATNWEGGSVPTPLVGSEVTGDFIVIPAGSGSITSGLNQSANTYGSLTVERGYRGTIGLAGVRGANPAYLRMAIRDGTDNVGSTSIDTSGRIYLDLGDSTTSVSVFSAPGMTSGNYGVWLRGTDITTLSVQGGSVGFEPSRGDAGHVENVEVRGRGAYVYTGPGDTGSIQAKIIGGTFQSCSPVGQCDIYSGRFETTEGCTLGNLYAYGGTSILNSTNTVTSVYLKKQTARVDMTQNQQERTITNLYPTEGTFLSGQHITITNRHHPDLPTREIYTTLR